MQNRWRRLSRTKKYTNAWIQVVEDKVIRPDRKRGIYGFLDMRPSVGVVAIDKRHRIALVEEYRYPLKVTTYEFPRGMVEKGENILAAAKREAQEEAGISGGRWTSMGILNPGPGFTNEFLHLYAVRDFRVGKAHPEGVEVQRVHWVPVPTLRLWMRTGKCNDAMTLAAVARYDTLAKKRKAR